MRNGMDREALVLATYSSTMQVLVLLEAVIFLSCGDHQRTLRKKNENWPCSHAK